MIGLSDISFNPSSPRNSSSLLHPAARRRRVILKIEHQHTLHRTGGNGGRTLQIAVFVSVARPISHIVVYTMGIRC